MPYSVRSDERLDYVNEKITLIQKNDGLTFGTDAFLLAAYTDILGFEIIPAADAMLHT